MMRFMMRFMITWSGGFEARNLVTKAAHAAAESGPATRGRGARGAAGP